MKYIIILFVLLTVSVYAQDSEPEPWNFIWGFSSTPRPFDVDSFQQKSILTGFQWGGSSQMNNALLNNYAVMGNYTSVSGTVNTPINVVLQPTWQDSTGYVPGYFGAPFIQYEPTLPIDSTNEGTILRPDDPADPIFGFRHREGTISNTPSDPNYSRLVLTKSSNYVGDTVLSDIWPQPNFRTKDWNDFRESGQTDNYLGRKWYLTINLRRLNPSIDNTINDDVVLNLKIPYTKWNGSTGYIKFNKLPINNQDSIVNFDTAAVGERGNYQKLEDVASTTNFQIKNRMIPINTTSSNITISAEFLTNDSATNNNPSFAKNNSNLDHIKSLDIQVQYLGNLDIAIDWVRIESASANILLKGLVDSIADWQQGYKDGRGYREFYISDSDSGQIRKYHIDKSAYYEWGPYLDVKNSIYTVIQTAIDAVKTESFNWQKAHLFRLKFQDTESDSYYWWGTLRYCNKFANGIYMTADGIVNPRLYRYYTNSTQRVVSMRLGNSTEAPVPWMRRGTHDWKTMGIKWGYFKKADPTDLYPFSDTLSSEYETQITPYGAMDDWSDLKDDEFYSNHLKYGSVVQAKYENTLIDHFYKSPQKDFLYANNNWIFQNILYNVQLWTDPANATIRRVYYDYSRRPYTAEEFRLFNMGAIIRGAKGIMVDGDENQKLPDVLSMGIGDYNKLNEYNDIYSDSVGTDFINYKYNTWNAWNYANLDTLSHYMQVDTDRVYIGTKSYRAEMFEINSFIRANDDLLMKLRLSATYSKGYRAYYSQDDELYGSGNLLSKFINIDTTKSYTERLFPKSPWDVNFLHEPFDSAFFDITILREKDVPMDSVFYIGVQNRRVDPLFHYIDPITNDSIMRFLSSAEFRDSCRIGQDSLLYQSYWWKRLGARKITIPFDYTYSDTNDYKLLRISEIGSDVDSLNQQWHRGPKYYDMVTDTVIGQDRSLSFDLLPGQGKILKVEVLKPGIVEGFLDNYNQTNLVGYPDAIDSNKNVYHLVLYKYSTKPDDPSKTYKEVHYIQSMPIDKNSNLENIVWNNATRMNISRRFLESLSSTDTNYVDCNHPALVVRKDSLGHPFAYVVYTCKDSSATNNDSALVVEAKIDAMTGVIQSNNQIFKLSFNDIDRFGTPTINASAKGNFLAWTDSVRGMIIGYQRPSEDVPSVIDSITPYQFDAFTPGALLYPSFNTYSDIKHGENNAGLVWYQAQKYGDGSGVFYSRIFFNELTNKIEKVIPPQFSGYYGFTTGLNLKTIRLAKTIKETKPIIYRDLKDYNDSNLAWCLYNRFDQINWIDSFYVYVPPPWTFHFSFNFINSLTLMHRDTNGYPEKWASTTINKYLFGGIFSDIQINSINSAQADGIVLDTTEVQVGGNYNLDFTIDGQEIYQLPGYTRSLNMSSMFGASMINYSENKARKAAHGSNVQLAKTMKPNFNANGQMWKNRRVYETSSTDSLDNPYILSSGKLFYKTYANEIVNHGYYGFTGDSNNVYFDLPKLEGDFGDISSRSVGFVPITPLDPCGDIFQATTNRDTILTNALNFPDYDNDGDREMQISMYGYKNSKVKVYLQRELDSSLTLLTMPTTSQYPYNATKLIYSILDSANSDFRLMYVNDDTTAHFNEKSFIYGMENADTISYKSAIEKDPVKYIIDFNNGGSQYVANHTNAIELKVYPNPTTGLVKVQAILPEEIDNYKLKNRDVSISIFNATGKLIVNKNGVSGQTFNFDLQNNPTGAYIIDAEYNDDTHPLKATENLVKQ